MTKRLLLSVLLSFVGISYASEQGFSKCLQSCQRTEQFCLNECSCHSGVPLSCTNKCFSQNTTCMTLCKDMQLKVSDDLPITHLPHSDVYRQGERCGLPLVYQYQ